MTEPRRPKPSSEPSNSGDESVSLLWMLAVLVRERRVVLATTAAGIILGLTIALLRPTTYTTAFSFLPQSEQDPSRAGLANLAGQFGISLGTLGGASQSPQLYADLLLTRGVLGPIAGERFSVGPTNQTPVPLGEFLGIRGADSAVVLEKTLRALRTKVIATTVATRSTGMITVRVRTKSPEVSLEIANRLLEGLNHFNLITRQSQAREERRFTEGRLEAAKASLRAAEDGLQRFLQKNRQYSDSPALTFERDRLQREVTLQQQVVSSLAQRYEEERIGEVRDTPVITVIEAPVLAARPDSRLRALIVLLGLAAGFCVSVLVVIRRDAWAKAHAVGSDPALALLSSEWKRIRGVAGS
jgi:uncharacterized protein involved in exopolysaccharide biosynthesis